MNYYKILGIFSLLLTLSCCKEEKNKNELIFGTTADYPPFEYYDHGEITGFDIDLAKLIAQKLGKKAIFKNLTFYSTLPSLNDGSIDAAIATLTITEERKKNFDFSTPYYTESIAVVFNKAHPIADASELSCKKIACQLGTTTELWLKAHTHSTMIVPMDNNNQAIEALKAGYVDGVLMDFLQAATFSEKNAHLSYALIAKSDNGYGIAFKKGSKLKANINKVLAMPDVKEAIQALEQQWLEMPK